MTEKPHGPRGGAAARTVGTAKGRQRQAAIVRTAARLLVELGPEAVNHRAVAAAAGVGLGTVTYHYPGADDLRQAAVDAVVEADIARMTAATRAVPLLRRDTEGTASMVVALLTPHTRAEMIAWYERYARGARDPVLAEAARRISAVARAGVSDVLARSGRATAPPAETVASVVDGAVLRALVDGASADEARARATRALTFVLGRG